MRDEPGSGEYLDVMSTYEMLIRWEIAAGYLAELETDGSLEDSALRTLINHDIPLLVSEIKKIRPEVWGTEVVRCVRVPLTSPG